MVCAVRLVMIASCAGEARIAREGLSSEGRFLWSDTMYRSEDMNRGNNVGKRALLILTAIVALWMGAGQSAQGQASSAVFIRPGYTSAVNSALGTKDYGAGAGHLAANSRGDVFYVAQPFSGAAAYLGEIPVNGSAQVEILSGLSGYTNPGVYADVNSNLWVPDQGGTSVVYVPFVNGGYATGVSASALSKCTFPMSANTTPCNFAWNITGLSNYIQPSDVAMDGNGNLYVVEKQDSVTNGANNRIVEFSTANGSMVDVAVDGLLEDGTAQLAVDPAGDIYYSNGKGVYYFAAGSLPVTSGESGGVSIGTGLSDPTGVSLDAGGNLYISDTGNSRLVEIPLVGGQINSQNQFDVITHAEILYGSNHAQAGVAIDGYGNIYFVGQSGNSINNVTMGNLSLGATAIGTATGSSSLTVNFNSSVMFGSFAFLGSTGTTSPYAVATNGCTNGQTYAAASNCTVTLTYTASAAGLQPGVIQALDSNGNVLGQATLSGSGQAALINVDPGTVSAVGKGWTSPSAIAVDAGGNTYVADASTGKIYKTAAGGTSPVVIASGFSSPSAVVLDGAGNLYVGDSGNNQIVEVPNVLGVYGTPVVLEAGLRGPSGLTIDGLGNLYIADSGNSRVLLLSHSGVEPAGSLVTTVGSGFTTPVSVAVDTANNLYVSDAGTEEVVQVALQTSQQTTILSGLKEAAGVAVDASGSVYAADTGSGTITRVPSISGVLNKNFESTLGTVVAKPVAIALDGSGNVYAVDEADAIVAESNRTAGSLNFGNVNVLAASASVSANVSDGGTAAMMLGTPDYTESGLNPASFAVQTSSTCASGASVNAGGSCSVTVIFTPQASGAESETLAFSSNAQNSATLLMSGSGTQLTNSVLTIAVTSPAGTPAYGQAITVGATLTPDAGGTATPMGTVTFYVDSVPQQPVTLTNDAASIVLTGLTGGAHVLSASYSGDDAYASSASANLDITISTAATVTSVVTVTAPYSNPTSANPGGSVTLSATVAPANGGTPTGTVTFYSGTTPLGSAPVVAAVVNGAPGGQATLTTTTLPLGNYNVTATYSGDSNFTGSSSASSVSLLISNATITMTASSLAIAGDGPPVTITLGSIAGFGQSTTEPSTVSLACTGLPTYATCSFSPAFATPTQGAPEQIALNVLINQPPPIPPTPAGFAGIPNFSGRPGLTGLIGLCMLVPGVLLGLALRRARRGNNRVWRMTAILLLMLGSCMAGMSGCGSSGKVFDTPKGTSNFTVTATISASPAAPNPPPVQTLTFTLTVN